MPPFLLIARENGTNNCSNGRPSGERGHTANTGEFWGASLPAVLDTLWQKEVKHAAWPSGTT